MESLKNKLDCLNPLVIISYLCWTVLVRPSSIPHAENGNSTLKN